MKTNQRVQNEAAAPRKSTVVIQRRVSDESASEAGWDRTGWRLGRSAAQRGGKAKKNENGYTKSFQVRPMGYHGWFHNGLAKAGGETGSW